MSDTRPPLTIVCLLASVVLYLICLAPGAICVAGSCRGWSGFFIAAFGWLEVAGIGRASFVVVTAWFANPAIWFAWALLMGRAYAAATGAGLLALLLALGYKLGTHVLVSESGGADAITGVGAGYWPWVASAGLACAAGLFGWIQFSSVTAPLTQRRKD